MPAEEAVRALVARLPLPPANIAGVLVAVIADRLRPWGLPGPRGLHGSLGGACVLAGSALAAWATAERPEAEIERPERVTTTGPYRFSRNPMYVGWHLIHLGAALLAGTAWGFLTLAAAIVETRHEIRREEREMAALFGPDFARYAARVPRYLGRRANG